MANTELNLNTLRPQIKVRARSGALEPLSPVTLRTTLGGGAVSAIGDLTDVTLTDVANNDMLVYSNATGQWVNHTLPTLAGTPNQISVTNASPFAYTAALPNELHVNNIVVANTLTVANLVAGDLSYTDITLTGNLSVAGTSTLHDLVVGGNTTVNNAVFNGYTTIQGSNLDITAAVYISTDVEIQGNLTVTGDATYVTSSDLYIYDNKIVLNAGLNNTAEPIRDAGIVVNRGGQANAEVIWNETTERWEIAKLTVGEEFRLSDNTKVIGVLDSVTNTSLNYVVAANTAKYLDQRITEAYTNASYNASNASFMTSGTVDNRLLNAANTTIAGIVQLFDGVDSTSTVFAPTANSVKHAFDVAIAANTLANTKLSAVTGGTVNGPVVIANTFAVSGGNTSTGNLTVTGKLTTTNPGSGDFHIIDGNVNFSSNSLFIDTVNKRVAIATSMPTAPLTIGGGGATLTTPLVQITEDENSYIQVAIQNLSNGQLASSDFVITADDGTDITNYIDMGKASSGYDYPDFSFARAHDGYLLNLGGNLNIAQGDPGLIQFFVGGTTNNYFAAAISSDYANTLFVNGSIQAVSISAELNASDITSGTIGATYLPLGNTSVAGAIQLVDAINNTSITYAASANAVKTAYDAAIAANNGLATAFSNAVSTAASDAATKAATAYANAIAYSANAAHILTGTIDIGRMPAFTGDITTTAGDTLTSLVATGVVGGTYGNTTAVPVFNIDTKGRVLTAAYANVRAVDAVTYTAANGTLTVTATNGNTFSAVINTANTYTATGNLFLSYATSRGVAFVDADNRVTGNAASFNFTDTTVDTYDGSKLIVGQRSDASATDTVNILYQADAYLPYSEIEEFTVSKSPGFTVSTSRGTEASPLVSQGGDFVGLFAAYAYTGSSPQYYETAGWRYYATGSSSSLGGEARLYTKKDNGDLTLAMTVDNTQSLTITGRITSSNTQDASSTTTGALHTAGGLGVGKQLWVGANAHINGNTTITGDVAISGNLVVSGTTTSTNVATIQVTDSIIQAASENITDAIDIGFIGQYSVDSGTTNAHTGLIRDSGTKKWYLFQGYAHEPAGNDLDITDPTFLAAPLVSGNVEIITTTPATSTTTGALKVAGGAGIAGNVYATAFNGSGAGLSSIPVGALVSSTITLNASNNVVVSNSGVVGIGGTVNIYSTDTLSTVTARDGNTASAITINNTLATGNVSVTGTISATANITGNTIISTVADGTPPLVVTSTTKVVNLNADKLDGLDSTQLVRSDSTAASDIFGLATITKTLTITTDWADTGIIGSDLTTGSFMVQLTADDAIVGGSDGQLYTGVASWYAGTAHDTADDEIQLHGVGDNARGQSLFLRTIGQSGNYIKLQISGTYAATGTSTYTFKFRRLI